MENAYSSGAVRHFETPRKYDRPNGTHITPQMFKGVHTCTYFLGAARIREIAKFRPPPGRRQLHLGADKKHVFLERRVYF